MKFHEVNLSKLKLCEVHCISYGACEPETRTELCFEAKQIQFAPGCYHIIHQSIPTAPCPPPPDNCGAFARLVSPGGGALANLARPGGRAFANPGDNPEKFVDVFKGMFS